MRDPSATRTTGRPNFRAEQRRGAARGTNVKPAFGGDRQNSLYPPDWEEISRSIRNRDGYRCQWHKLSGGKTCAAYFPPPFSHYLHVHHIDPLPRGSNKPNNLIALCIEHHGEAHGRRVGNGPSEKVLAALKKW